MIPATRTNPLSYLTDQLYKLIAGSTDSGKRALAAALCLCGLCNGQAATPLATHSLTTSSIHMAPVSVRFITSPVSDYLFYLFYRSTKDFAQLESSVPLGKIPTLDDTISLPEQAASTQIESYAALYPLLKQYEGAKSRVVPLQESGTERFRILGYSDPLPAYAQIADIVHQGERSFPAFQAFWKTNIAPQEDAQVNVWKQQLSECAPLDKLQELERLSFPYAHLDVAAIALHLSGSGNTYPAGVYTSLFKKPNLAWVLGHEATHLMVDQYAGHNWRAHPLADQAIALVKNHKGAASDIEESLALFMQVKVSQSCRYTDASRKISDKFDAATPTGQILRSLEARWDAYRSDGNKNIIDFMLESTLQAFKE